MNAILGCETFMHYLKKVRWRTNFYTLIPPGSVSFCRIRIHETFADKDPDPLANPIQIMGKTKKILQKYYL